MPGSAENKISGVGPESPVFTGGQVPLADYSEALLPFYYLTDYAGESITPGYDTKARHIFFALNLLHSFLLQTIPETFLATHPLDEVPSQDSPDAEYYYEVWSEGEFDTLAWTLFNRLVSLHTTSTDEEFLTIVQLFSEFKDVAFKGILRS